MDANAYTMRALRETLDTHIGSPDAPAYSGRWSVQLKNGRTYRGEVIPTVFGAFNLIPRKNARKMIRVDSPEVVRLIDPSGFTRFAIDETAEHLGRISLGMELAALVGTRVLPYAGGHVRTITRSEVAGRTVVLYSQREDLATPCPDPTHNLRAYDCRDEATHYGIDEVRRGAEHLARVEASK